MTEQERKEIIRAAKTASELVVRYEGGEEDEDWTIEDLKNVYLHEIVTWWADAATVFGGSTVTVILQKTW